MANEWYLDVPPPNPTSTTAASARSLTSSNNYDEIFKKINAIGTDIDTSATDNFDASTLLDPLKTKAANLGQGVTQADISKIADMRPPNQYESGIKTGLDTMQQFMDPKSGIYQGIFDRTLNRYDATAANNSLKMAQTVAANPNVSESGKRTAIAEMNRMSGANRADLMSDTANKIADMVQTAARDFTTQSINASTYQETKFLNSANLAMQDMANKIQALNVEGMLTTTELNLGWQKALSTVTNGFERAKLELEKAGLVQNNQNYKDQARQLDFTMFDFFDKKIDTALADLKTTFEAEGKTLTVEDVMANPELMAYFGETINITGGDIEDYIQGKITTTKLATQTDAEDVNILKQRYIARGMTPEQAESAAGYYSDILLGAVSNPDGTVYIPGADGKPMATIDKDGNITMTAEESVAGTDSTKTTLTMPTNIWGQDAQKILTESKGTQVYNDLIEARVDDIITGGSYYRLKTEPVTSPLYSAIAERLEPATLVYRNRAGFNDEWVKAPSEGEWVTIDTPYGKRIVEVTYKGLIDTSGTSDRAYIEFRTPDGQYFSAHDSNKIRTGRVTENLK